MADVHIYVDPDASGAGDGTSWTDAYTSLYTAVEAWKGDISAAGSGDSHYYHLSASSGSEDVITVNINIRDYTTDFDNRIYIINEQPHSGAWDTSVYRLRVNANIAGFNCRAESCIISGVQIDCSQGGTSNRGILQQLGGAPKTYIHIDKCIVRGNPSDAGLYFNDVSDDVTSEIYVTNNVVYNFFDYGIYANDGGAIASIHFINNTIYDLTDSGGGTLGRGIRAADNYAYYHNNVVYSAADEYNGTQFSAASYNAGSQGDTIGTNSVELSSYTKTQIFVDPDNDNYRAVDAGPLDGTGTDAYSGIPGMNYDLDWSERQTPWSLGAYDPNEPSAGAAWVGPEYARILFIT